MNLTGFSEVRQPVVDKNQVLGVPTFPSANVSGTIVQLGAGVGVGSESGPAWASQW